MKYDRFEDAVHAWVNEFNVVPQGIVQKLLQLDIDNVMEITPPSKYDRVSVFGVGYNGDEGEIVGSEIVDDERKYIVVLDSSDVVKASEMDIEVHRHDYLPMWGIMWAFGDFLDNEWLEKEENLQAMADCGFRIYEQEDYGYIFGIDGAGYDFYESHWNGLYKARGLKWHNVEAEVTK